MFETLYKIRCNVFLFKKKHYLLIYKKDDKQVFGSFQDLSTFRFDFL